MYPFQTKLGLINYYVILWCNTYSKTNILLPCAEASQQLRKIHYGTKLWILLFKLLNILDLDSAESLFAAGVASVLQSVFSSVQFVWYL